MLSLFAERNPVKTLISVLSLCCLVVPVADLQGAEITLGKLLKEMTAMEQLPDFPEPAYTCKQFSSYDRASKSPSQEWFANGDAGHYLRVEDTANGKEHVMMDVEGPGAIVRIWSANPAGNIRIYIDGQKTPAITAPMDQLLGGSFPGLPKPIAGEYSKGWNLYFPIPYAKHCKVTSDKGGFYYHINYRTYEKGTKVESFKAEQLKKFEGEIKKVAEDLANPSQVRASAKTKPSKFEVDLPPGETALQEFKGPAAIYRSVTKLTAGNTEAALRGVIVSAQFDGQKCVEVPLGDFFGTAPGVNPYESLPLGMFKDGKMYSQWVMPFEQTAVIELRNTTSETVRLEGEIVVGEYNWTGKSMHFHAGWRAEYDVPTRPMIDWNYLTAEGQGIFAGAAFAIDNPVKHWWGEGDEKIYVDGESFPSHFGTGTEDYYGYAWCWPGLFTHAYHAQPRCDGPANYGRTSVNRFHVLDRIPFNKTFKFDMELWHWHDNSKVNMAVTTYWYGRPGASSKYAPITKEMIAVRPLEPYKAPKVEGALEGESMKIVEVKGTAAPQDWVGLSGDQHLWWHQGFKPGDKLTVAFNVPEAGKYKVLGRFLKAKDYGIHQLAINGQKAVEPMDFYNPEVVPSHERNLGVFELKQGENTLQVTAVEANPKAVKSYMFGLDYLRLEKAQ